MLQWGLPAPPEAISSAGPAVQIPDPNRRTAPPSGKPAPRGLCSPPPAHSGHHHLQYMHTLQSNSPSTMSFKCRAVEPGFTDVTNEDDFGVGGNMLGEKGLLVVRQHEFMLTGWVCFSWRGSCQIKEVKPAFCSNSNHKILSKRGRKKNTHRRRTQCCEHRHQNIHDMQPTTEPTFPLLQTSPTATQVSWWSKTH